MPDRMTGYEFLVQLGLGAYATIRRDYARVVKASLLEYLMGESKPITVFRNQFKRAIADAFDESFWMGYADGGSAITEADPDDQSWLAAAVEGEFGYVDMLYDQIKELKKEGLSGQEAEDWCNERAEGYAKTLDGVYSQGRLRANKNLMVTFGGEDGHESCSTCQRLKGKRHSVRYWLRRGLSKFRGNRNYECGCWQCQHFFYDDKGNVVTI